MNAIYLSLAQLARDLEKLRWVRYQTNPFIPQHDQAGAPTMYHLTQQNVYLLNPGNEDLFRTVVAQAGLVPHAMTSADWAETSPLNQEILINFDQPVWR